jgi:hypothetical protein
MISKILKVAQREYAETVKTKTFILGVLMTPLIIGGIIYFSSRYAHSGTGPRLPKQIAVMDQTGAFADAIRTRLVLEASILDGSGKMQFYTRDPKASDMDYMGTVENLISRAVVNKRCQRANISPEVLATLWHVPRQQIEVGEDLDQERMREKTETITRVMVPFFFMYLMFIGIVGMGQHDDEPVVRCGLWNRPLAGNEYFD